MNRTKRIPFRLGTAWVSLLTLLALANLGFFGQVLASQEEPKPLEPAVVIGGVVGGVVNPGPWWIGIQCRSVDPPLREHLGLEENVGLLVEEVLKDSPAAKAGLRRFDVLVRANEKPLRTVQELLDVINAANGGEVKLEYIRKGQKAETTVTPEKRPGLPVQPPRSWWEWRGFEWPEWEFFGGPGGPFRFRFFYPGRVFPPRAEKTPPLPGNLTITITKKGDEPAKIVVKRDGESWEVTEQELDKLPADIRPHVEQLLRGPAAPGPGVPPGAQPERPQERRYWLPGPPWWSFEEEQKLRERIEREMKEIQRRMEELRQSIEELRKGMPGPRGPGRPQPRGPRQEAPEESQTT
jgi:hypothetical protein